METPTRVVEWSGQDCLATVEELSNFVKSLITEDCNIGRERRVSLRHKFIVEVVAQHADANHLPVGSAYSAVTRDISTSGLRLISPTFVNTPFLIVEIPHPSGSTKRLLLKVRRCRPFRKYFEVGGIFVTELSS